MTDWDIAVGETLLRSELHDRWGGGRYGGMEPAVRANSVFLFSNPSVGAVYGYKYDGWHRDGTYHYTGDGQVADQSPDTGGNRDLLKAASLGRTIRLFESERTSTTYVGAFELADPPWFPADARDRNHEMRKVIVFRLAPIGGVARGLVDFAVEPSQPEELPLEASNIDAYVVGRPEEPPVGVRREAELVKAYAEWLAARGEEAVRHRLPLPSGGQLYTDIFNKSRGELLEAKASAARVHVRTGLGQLLDYGRFLNHNRRSLLLPSRPADDLVELLHAHGVGLVWRTDVSFERSDAP